MNKNELTVKTSQVTMQTSRLSELTDLLGKVLSDLTNKLGPVLRSTDEKITQSEQPEQCIVPLADSIRSSNNRIEERINDIRNLIDSIEI